MILCRDIYALLHVISLVDWPKHVKSRLWRVFGYMVWRYMQVVVTAAIVSNDATPRGGVGGAWSGQETDYLTWQQPQVWLQPNPSVRLSIWIALNHTTCSHNVQDIRHVVHIFVERLKVQVHKTNNYLSDCHNSAGAFDVAAMILCFLRCWHWTLTDLSLAAVCRWPCLMLTCNYKNSVWKGDLQGLLQVFSRWFNQN